MSLYTSAKKYGIAVSLILLGIGSITYAAVDYFYLGALSNTALFALSLLGCCLVHWGDLLYQKAAQLLDTSTWQTSKPTMASLSHVKNQPNLKGKYVDLDWLCHFTRTYKFSPPQKRLQVDLNTFTKTFGTQVTLDTITKFCPGAPEDRVRHLIVSQNALKSRSVVELISNAIDASRERVTLPHVDVTIANGKMTVTDAGNGMSLHDIYQNLLLLRQSSKEQQKDAIGRFGVGFFTSLAHLNTEQDAVIFDTKADDCAGYRVIFRFVPKAKRSKHASPWACRIEANPNITETGTKVTVISKDIELDKFLETTKHYFQFHQDAKIIVNKKSVSRCDQFIPLGDDILVQQSENNEQANVAVTIAGITIESYPTQQKDDSMNVVWRLPQATRLLYDRGTVILDSIDTYNAINKHMNKVNDIALDDEKLAYLNSIAPMVENLQKQNHLKGNQYNLENQICNIAKEILKNRQCIPNRSELLPLSQENTCLVHPLLLKKTKWQQQFGYAAKEWYSSKGVRCYVMPIKEQELIYDNKEKILYVNKASYEKIMADGKNYDTLNSALTMLPAELIGRCYFVKPKASRSHASSLSKAKHTNKADSKVLQRFKMSKADLKKIFDADKPTANQHHLFGPYSFWGKTYYVIKDKIFQHQITILDHNFKRINIYNDELRNFLVNMGRSTEKLANTPKLQAFVNEKDERRVITDSQQNILTDTDFGKVARMDEILFQELLADGHPKKLPNKLADLDITPLKTAANSSASVNLITNYNAEEPDKYFFLWHQPGMPSLRLTAKLLCPADAVEDRFTFEFEHEGETWRTRQLPKFANYFVVYKADTPSTSNDEPTKYYEYSFNTNAFVPITDENLNKALAEQSVFDADDIERINSISDEHNMELIGENSFILNDDIYCTATDNVLSTQQAKDNLAWLNRQKTTQLEHARCAAFIHLPHPLFKQLYPHMQKLKHVPIYDEIASYQSIQTNPDKDALLYLLDEINYVAAEYLNSNTIVKIIALQDEYADTILKDFTEKFIACRLLAEEPRRTVYAVLRKKELRDSIRTNEKNANLIDDSIEIMLSTARIHILYKGYPEIQQRIFHKMKWYSHDLLCSLSETDKDFLKLKELYPKVTGYISEHPLEASVRDPQKSDSLKDFTLSERVIFFSLFTDLGNLLKPEAADAVTIKAPASAKSVKLSENNVRYSVNSTTYSEDAKSYAKRNLISAIRHQADPKKALYLRELIQNAIDAIADKQGDKYVDIKLELAKTADGPRCKLTVHDQGSGMTEDTLDRKLLRPNISSKSAVDKEGNPINLGGFGVGFFTALDNCNRLLIETSTDNKLVHCRELIPVYEKNEIIDVDVKKWSYKTEYFKGTRVTRYNRNKNNILEASKIYSAVQLHASYIDPKTAVIRINEKPINKESLSSLAEQSVPNLGIIKIYSAPDNVFTAGGLFVKDFSTEEKDSLAKPLKKMLTITPILIDLPKNIALIGGRNDFSVKVKERVEHCMPSLLILAYHGQYLNDKLSSSGIDGDFVSQNSFSSLKKRSPKAKQDAEELLRMGSLNHIERYQTEQALADLICYLPAITYQNKKYSLVELTELYHQKKISKELRKGIDQIPALKRQFETADGSEELEAGQKARLKKLKDDTINKNNLSKLKSAFSNISLKKEWLPKKVHPKNVAWEFYARLSDELFKIILPDANIKIGYSTKLGDAEAYTTQSGNTIYWNPFSREKLVGKLCNALSSDNENLFNTTVAEMLTTLTHERTHIGEAPCDGTHNGDFLRKLAEARINLACKLDRSTLFAKYKGIMNKFKQQTANKSVAASSAESFIKAQLLGVVDEDVASENVNTPEPTSTTQSVRINISPAV